MSPYRYILCYIQGCKGTNNDQEGSGHVVRVDLQESMLSPRSKMYTGTTCLDRDAKLVKITGVKGIELNG